MTDVPFSTVFEYGNAQRPGGGQCDEPPAAAQPSVGGGDRPRLPCPARGIADRLALHRRQ
jgi:hypothetical protein